MSLFGGKRREGDSGVEFSGAATSGAKPMSAEREATRAERGGASGNGGQAMANIGKSISIKGDLTGNEDIVIDGTVEGTVQLPDGELTIGASGTVRGEIRARSVVIVGRLEGDVIASERLEIQATGAVLGDVTAPRLVVSDGAAVNGVIQMEKTESQSTAKSTKAATSASASSARPAAGAESGVSRPAPPRPS